MEAATTEAAIVAGGGAGRFAGRDKSRLVVEGRTIIVRQLEVLQQVASRVSIVGALPERFADLEVAVVPDRVPGLGAIGGIYSALLSATSDSVLVVACDMPFLDAGLLRRLVILAADHDGAWVSTSRGIEPLLACYRRRAAERIGIAIEQGRLKAMSLGSTLDMAVLGEADLASHGSLDRLLANVNSPEDYARVQYRPS
jgi:molybdopterin-guanine dinucleotide biosynthesis protein A